jgi:hypothetical protein
VAVIENPSFVICDDYQRPRSPISLPSISFFTPNSSLMKYHVKVKAKLSLCFNWAPRHEDVLGEWRYSSTQSLTSALDGGEWLASRPGRFTPREKAPGTHWIGGWVGPRAFLDAVVEVSIFLWWNITYGRKSMKLFFWSLELKLTDNSHFCVFTCPIRYTGQGPSENNSASDG